ncbi:MAG: hypothetical protein J6T78_04425 [Bacteroidaceae bacterium]|nr:hypothetical protein [Bacteroidaceae bacterium]
MAESYKVGGCSKATFNRLVREHKLITRKVYFVADRASEESGLLTTDETGALYIATSDRTFMKTSDTGSENERPADKVFTIQNNVTDYRSFYFARWKRYDYPDPNEQSVSYNSVRKFHVRVTKEVEEYSSPIVTDVTFLYCGYSAMAIGNTGRGGTYLIIDGVPVNTDATGNEGTFYYGDIAVYNGHYVSEDDTSYNYLGFVTYQDSELPQPRTDRMKVEIWHEGFYITDGKDDGFEWLDGQVHTHEDGYPWSLQQLSTVCEYAYWNLRTVENTNNKSWTIASDSPDETYPTCRSVYNFVTGLLANKTEYWDIEFYTYSRQVITAPAEMTHFIVLQSYGANSVVDITNIGTFNGKVLEFLNLNGNSYKIKTDAETEIEIGGGFTMSKVLVVFKSNAWHIYKVAELTEIQ